MRVDFVTKEDLNEFRLVLLTDLTRLLKRADPAQPWRVHFPEPFLARYVRIALLDAGILHLRRVQVFESPPFGKPVWYTIRRL